MIFASDLDKTLIYTKKLIDDDYIKHVVPVEEYLGRELSFMTKNTIKKLKLINNKILFIPVTTRTTEQYNRIFGIKEEINPKYAVTSNGGVILENGEISIEWSKIIKESLENSTRANIVEKQFLKSFSDLSWINKMVFRDNLFFSVHFDEINNNSKKELKNFENWIIKNKWDISLQGKKLYIVPNEVNKWNAIAYIKDKEKKKRIIAAGDSYLDYPILINADYAIGALHGELKKLIDKNKIKQKHIVISKKSGINVSEEILDFVNDIVNINMSYYIY